MRKQTINLFEIAKKVYCSSIEEIEPIFGEYVIYNIECNGVTFEILTNLKKNSPSFYIFGQGAVNKEKRQKYGTPVFHRWSWIADFKYSAIIINDPTIYIDNLEVGWFQGTQNKYYLPLLCTIIQEFLDKLNLKSKDTFFCGSSAGGFTSLMMAAYFPASSVFANNPQTDIRKYRSSLVKKLLSASFSNISIQESNNCQFDSRFSVMECYRKMGNIPNIYYAQNSQDTFHLQHHYFPFIHDLHQYLAANHDLNKIHLFTEIYSSKSTLHNPLPKKEFIKRLYRIKHLFGK